MGMRIKSLLGAVMLSAVATSISDAATAQDAPVFRPRETVPTTINRTYFGKLGEFSDRNPLRSTQLLIGTPFGFPENQISRDAERLHRLYTDLINQQVSSDPIIRTADLPNPYNFSVLTLPSSNNPVSGSEFSIEQPLESRLPTQPAALPAPTQLPQRF